MSWIYKNDNGRYLHSFYVHRGVVEDIAWSDEQHDAYRFDDRNRGAWVAFRCRSSGSLRRLVPKQKPPESTGHQRALVQALLPFADIDLSDADNLGMTEEVQQARTVLEMVSRHASEKRSTERKGTP